MRNDVGLYTLFGENVKSKELFYEWCKSCDELCEYDLEHIENDLYIPTINNLPRYFHFNTGNILDWLETHDYRIGLPVRNLKYVSVTYKGSGVVYNNSGVKTRNRALELGVINAIKDLETNIK